MALALPVKRDALERCLQYHVDLLRKQLNNWSRRALNKAVLILFGALFKKNKIHFQGAGVTKHLVVKRIPSI